MDTRRGQRYEVRNRAKALAGNVAAAGIGAGVGYGTGVLATKALVSKGPYAKHLRSLSKAERLREIRRLRDVVGVGAGMSGALTTAVALQRLRKAREDDRMLMRKKLEEIRS